MESERVADVGLRPHTEPGRAGGFLWGFQAACTCPVWPRRGRGVAGDGYESLSPQSVFSSAVYSLRKVRKHVLSEKRPGS